MLQRGVEEVVMWEGVWGFISSPDAQSKMDLIKSDQENLVNGYFFKMDR